MDDPRIIAIRSHLILGSASKPIAAATQGFLGNAECRDFPSSLILGTRTRRVIRESFCARYP